MFEYKVVEQRFGSPKEVEDALNYYAREGWEHYDTSTIGPIPSRWLYFRRTVTAPVPHAGVGRGGMMGT